MVQRRKTSASPTPEAADDSEKQDLVLRDLSFDSNSATAPPDGFGWSNDIPMDAVDWLWKPVIPVGAVTIVAGAGGCTKTSLLCDVAAKVSRGLLPGDFEEQNLKTLYLSKEDSAATSLVPKMTVAHALPG